MPWDNLLSAPSQHLTNFAARLAAIRATLQGDTQIELWWQERGNRELRQANEILRKASAYFAQAELDSPFCK